MPSLCRHRFRKEEFHSAQRSRSLRDPRHPAPLVVRHERRMTDDGVEGARWDRLDGSGRGHGADESPPRTSLSFGPSNGNARGRGFQDDWSPRPTATGHHNGPGRWRGRGGSRGGSRPARGRLVQNQGERAPPHNHQRLQHQEHRPPREGGAKRGAAWRDRPPAADRPPPRDLDPKMPRQREQDWKEQKSEDMTIVTEETLTIKVDMSRPVNRSR